ncbi:MAG: hypothetical protein NTZ95_01450, partial [Candidatus Omnitrophica bacterium]|nr:hypothetical protein [Candidatus Omnitrophota bacterium]
MMYAESDYAVKLLEANHSPCLLLSSGKYLVTKKTADDDLKLIKAISHEDIEAIMQILLQEQRNNKSSKYQGIKELILKHFPPRNDDKAPRYLTLNEDNNYSLELYVNHLVAKAFEWLIPLHEKILTEDVIPPEEMKFLKEIAPIIMDNRHNYFTAEFWDSNEKGKRIRKARNDGMVFYQATNGQPSEGPIATPVEAAKELEESLIDVAEVINVHTKFQELVRNNVIGQDVPEGYKVSLREIIRLADFVKAHKHLLNPNLALAWGMREIYYRRLQTDHDKDEFRSLIYKMKCLKGIDLEPLFGHELTEVESLIREYGNAGAYLMYHMKGDIPEEAREQVARIVNLPKTKDDEGQRILAMLVLTKLPPELAIEVFGLLDIMTPDAIEAYGDIVKNLKDPEKKIEAIKKLAPMIAGNVSTGFEQAITPAINASAEISASLRDDYYDVKIEVLNRILQFLADYRYPVAYSAVKASNLILNSVKDDSVKLKVLNELTKTFDTDPPTKEKNEYEEFTINVYRGIALSLSDDSSKISSLEALAKVCFDGSRNNSADRQWQAARAYGEIAASIKDTLGNPLKKRILAELKEPLFRHYDDSGRRHRSMDAYNAIAASLIDDTDKIEIINEFTQLLNYESKPHDDWHTAYIIGFAIDVCGAVAPTLEKDADKIDVLDKLKAKFEHSFGNPMYTTTEKSLPEAYGAITASLKDEARKVEELRWLKTRFAFKDWSDAVLAMKTAAPIAASIRGVEYEGEKINIVNALEPLMHISDKERPYVEMESAWAIGDIASSIVSDKEKMKVLKKLIAYIRLHKNALPVMRDIGKIGTLLKSDAEKTKVLKLLLNFSESHISVDTLLREIYSGICVSLKDESARIRAFYDLLESKNAKDLPYGLVYDSSAAWACQNMILSFKDHREKLKALARLGALMRNPDIVQTLTININKAVIEDVFNANKARIDELYNYNHAHFIETYGTNITQVKASPYDIEVDEEHKVIKGKVNGSIVVEQPIL